MGKTTGDGYKKESAFLRATRPASDAPPPTLVPPILMVPLRTKTTRPPLGALPGPQTRWLLAAAAAMLLPVAARAQPAGLPPASSQPFPTIEAGMHTAIINRIGVDAAGRYAVTASDDKTARVWDLASGKQLAVLRVPLGADNEGKLYAVALSPDGRLVALGGWADPDGFNNHSLYLFDRASGRMVQRIDGLSEVINHLAFSADGRHLAAALGDSNGIRVFSGGPPWKEVARDTDYEGGSYSVTFDRTGRLVATCEDGKLRLYDAFFRLIAVREVEGGNDPTHARFSPDGRRIAVGFYDSTAVSVVSGADLSPLFQADTKGVDNGSLSSVAWSADGQTLVAAGRNSLPNGRLPLRSWDAQGLGPLRTLPLANVTSTVMDLRSLAGGRLVFAAASPAWGVVDNDGRELVFQGPPILDHRGNFDAFRLSPSAEILEFKHGTWRDGKWQRTLARFDLTTRRLERNVSPRAGLQAPRTTRLPVTNWEDSTTPRLGETPLDLKPYERSRSLAVSRDGQRFALGAEWSVYLFDARGQRRWRKPLPGVAWLVNLSDDGRYVVAALGDGTIRWYRSSDGTEALALFVHGDGKRWVVWTPEGFYDAAPGADGLIGYHLNNGRDAAGTFISSAQLQRQFYRPDLIARRIAGDEAAIAAAVAAVGDVRQTLRAASLPPALTILSQRLLSDGDLEITYRLEDRGGGIGPVELRLDGAVLEGRANPPVAGINRHRLPPPSGKARLQLLAYSRGGLVASQPVGLDVKGAASSEPTTLHLLAVGITAYRDGALRSGVRFAAGDASAFRDALSTPGRASTARVADPVLLIDEQATAGRIRQELQAMAKRVRPADLFVLYLAGHGVSDEKGEYVFLPVDLVYRNRESMASGLGGEELRTILRLIPSSKIVVVLDTCSSGSFGLSGRSLGEKGAIDRLARLSGRVVFAAAGDQKMALESPDNQRGIFTGVLLRALAGEADTNRDGQVGVREVAEFVEAEVQRITRQLFGYEQNPMSDLGTASFPLSRSGGGR